MNAIHNIKTNKVLLAAVLIGLAYHGASVFFTLNKTYDALVHLFFANHYATSWFEPWNYSWYTGFNTMGYPPLVHQSMALFSFIGGLSFSLYTLAAIGVVLFITGVYRMTLMITNHRATAGYAAVLAVFSSSFVETLHLFGQLPSIIGISVLMHALPEIYLWVFGGKKKHLIRAFSLLAVTVCSHHVTPIFGMVFFIFPVIGMAIMDQAKKDTGSYKEVRFKHFFKSLKTTFKRVLVFGTGSLALIIGCILPYWINSKNNPITQVPIPHGSRDNFIEVGSSGFIFFLVPWGLFLLLWPFIFSRFFTKRYLFFGISFALLCLLGTGGTTPIPRLILGDNAFSILTLDRFTLWASIMALPMVALFTFRLIHGDFKLVISARLSPIGYKFITGGIIGLYLIVSLATVNLVNLRPSQPEAIDMQPIVNFLNQDQHYKWRYLPLGFGDQMAMLSTKTQAHTIDGNYHSSRRLPELTSRAVERLENSKYRGVEGLGSLQQFLTSPEKYHLKYVFSNDKFYDPILFFTGWTQLPVLENGIAVWQKAGVSPLPAILPKEDVPLYLRLWWGIVPLFTVFIVLLINIKSIYNRTFGVRKEHNWAKEYVHKSVRRWQFNIQALWAIVCLFGIFGLGLGLTISNAEQISPQNNILAYYDALDFKDFKKAYSLMDQRDYSLDQFMLETAVSDGLVSSYGKLDAISLETLMQNDSLAVIKANTTWITPLSLYESSQVHTLTKMANQWTLKRPEISNDIPPDQFIARNKNVFYNQGRRALTTKTGFYKDVLKQPRVALLQSKLIQVGKQYNIIGDFINIDNRPADVSIEAILYDSNNRVLAKYNVKDIMKHHLLPKERSSFRLEFEAVSWSKNLESAAGTFDPLEFNPTELSQTPSRYQIVITSNVTSQEIYNDVAINRLKIRAHSIDGSLFNSGTSGVIIPQVLISYYDQNKQLIWVSTQYLEKNIRPQRRAEFKIALNQNTASIFQIDVDKVWNVNGISNDQMWNSLDALIQNFEHPKDLIPVKGKDYAYIRIQLNNYTNQIQRP
ncbi:MAG: hypothetical protein ABJM06_13180 [Gilvibacter sp.]